MTEEIIENNNKSVLKSGIWYTISNFLLKSISFITIPIFTRLLTQEEFGQFNNYSSWLQIMSIFVTLNLQSSLISAKYDYKDDFDKYILSMFSLSSISAIIWAVLLNFFSKFFTSFSNLELYYINCMIIYLFFYSAFALFQIRARFLFEYKSNVILTIINAIFTALLSVALALFMKDRLQGRILGSIIPTIIIGFGLIIYLIKKGKKINVSYWKYALKVCLPYIPHALSLVLLSSMDRIMITKICGNEKTALYSLAYNCGLIITLLVNSLNEAYAPWLGDKLNENNFNYIRKLSKQYIFIFLFLAFGIILVIPEVLLILGGKTYLEAKLVLAPVALSCIYQFLYTMFVNIEQFKKKTGIMAVASISAAVLNYVLNLIFINKFGYVAAAYTTVAGYIWLLAIHMIIVHKIGYSNVYDYKFIIMTAILALVLTILISLLYLNLILRYVFIVIYLSVISFGAYKYKTQTIEFIRNLKKK